MLKGTYHTEKAKRKLSEIRIKKGLSKAENNPMFGIHFSGEKNGMWGKKHSEKSKRKMSLLKIGNKHCVGHKLSEETKRKISETRAGEKNPMWKGGITPLNHLIRNSPKFKDWRKAVFERDDYTCQNSKCGQRGGRLEAHHKKSFADFPGLRFDIDNGLTLCIECHKG